MCYADFLLALLYLDASERNKVVYLIWVTHWNKRGDYRTLEEIKATWKPNAHTILKFTGTVDDESTAQIREALKDLEKIEDDAW